MLNWRIIFLFILYHATIYEIDIRFEHKMPVSPLFGYIHSN